jgi:1,4-dihydroxy-2-naphthoate polyprenyltransferase
LRITFAHLLAFVRLGRPLFLTGGFVLYALGAAVAAASGHPFHVDQYLLGQGAVTAFQLMTHYANDYFDFEADRANATPTRWSGGSRVLPQGELPRGVALAAALLLAVAGTVISAVIGAGGRVGPLAVPALALALVLSWSYSAPPLRLHSSGVGELTVVAVVTALVPFLGFHLQAPALTGFGTVVLAILPLGFLQFAMLIAIELPDAAGDAAVGKRTLVVRLGDRRAARLYATTVAAAYLMLPLLAWGGLPTQVALAAALPAPVALWRIRRICAGDFRQPRRWESIAFWAVALLVATAMAELAAFSVLAWRG